MGSLEDFNFRSEALNKPRGPAKIPNDMRNDIMLSMNAESKEQTLALHSSLDSLLSALFPVQSSLSIRPASSLSLCIPPQSFLIILPCTFPTHSLCIPSSLCMCLLNWFTCVTSTQTLFAQICRRKPTLARAGNQFCSTVRIMQICQCDYASQQLHFGGLREDDIDKRLRHSSPLVSLTTNWIVEMCGSSTLHSD